jgi:succinate dehydrogenase / fumarate reductase, cytochrome b subunit
MADGVRAEKRKGGPTGRPLSPHLQIWRWHATMLTSILHRATGVALYIGALLFALWLASIALGPPAYALSSALIGSVIGQIVLWGIVFSASFHVLSGLRHLVWDMGAGFNPKLSSLFSNLIIVGAVLLTAGIWFWSVTMTAPMPHLQGMPIQ